MANVAELVDVLDFAHGVIEDLAKAKEDDNKISAMELVGLAVENASAGIKAAAGLDKIGEELKDLDAEEVKLIAEKSIEIAKAAVKLVKG